VFNLSLAAMIVPEEDGAVPEYDGRSANRRYFHMMPP